MEKIGSKPSNTTDKLIAERQATKKTAIPQKKIEDDGLADSMPDYVVSVTTEKVAEKGTYSPAELKSKARAFISMGANPEEQRVLNDILGAKDKVEE